MNSTDGITNRIFAVGFSAITIGGLIVGCLRGRRKLNRVDYRNIVIITGCDSGIGYNIAEKCHSYGMTVIAGCLNLHSDGAKSLKQKSSEKLHTIELDLQKSETILNSINYLLDIKSKNPDHKLYALVNNAGVMCMGEFEWQTDSLIEKQVGVNFLGTMKMTNALIPYIRQDGGRIITVTSHCGIQSLPSLTVYGATKAGLQNWMDGLRHEMNQYNVKVVDFIPGSFVMSTNLASNQSGFANEMRSSMSLEQKKFYGVYFEMFNEYLKIISGKKPVAELKDDGFFQNIEGALLATNPKPVYRYEPWRYVFYHILFKYSPHCLKGYFVDKFTQMPKYLDTMK